LGKPSDKTLETVTAIAARVVARLGLELDRVQVALGKKQSVVRVFVDKEGGVTIDDCQRVSEELGTVLDVEDPIEGHYDLEVSSPGLDRPLLEESDYRKFAGRLVRLHTYGPVEGTRDFVGVLVGLEGGVVRVHDQATGRNMEIPYEKVAKARLEVEI
jgi:ribosome maturation factor RimP